MKHCKYCGTDQPVSNFDVRRASKDGLSFKCKPCAREYARARYLVTADRFKARALIWAKDNPERRLEIRRTSAERHAESKRAKGREYNRRLRLEDPDRVRLAGRLHAKIRRERVLKTEGTVTMTEVSDLLERAGGICVYCGSTDPLTLDHFDPIVRGGTGFIGNLIPCCKPCNSSKNASDPIDWIYSRRGVVGLARTTMFLEGNPQWRALYGLKIREVMP